jgi:16S rRNA (guanine966-N2)-methyltransferase
VRIVSGKLKGRRIPVRKNFPSRPTTDFAKESLFNVLNNHFDFEGMRVLDLFAGTGSISYEFASRGAEVTSVELNFRSYRFIQETAHNLQLDKIRAIKADAFSYIGKAVDKYDIVFADPPYQLEGIDKLPELVLNSEIMAEGGCFILEHSDQKKFTGHQFLSDKRSYGSVNFSIFRKK